MKPREILSMSIWSLHSRGWVVHSQRDGIEPVIYQLIIDWFAELEHEPEIVYVDQRPVYIIDDMVPGYIYYIYINPTRREEIPE
jgi:hypothetical protein